MQTPPQRVTRQGRPRNDPARPTTAGWFGLILFFFLAGIGAIGALATISLYSALASNLNPVEDMQDYELPEEVDRLRPQRHRARPVRRVQARGRRVRRDPADPGRRDDGHRGPDVLGERRLRPRRDHRAGLDALRGRARGASTITQQLVRQRLLDDDLRPGPGSLAERKLKEIIQSIRVTQAYPGEPGKQRIIAAYLNQNYYGNESYGVEAAARAYFGVNDLAS